MLGLLEPVACIITWTYSQPFSLRQVALPFAQLTCRSDEIPKPDTFACDYGGSGYQLYTPRIRHGSASSVFWVHFSHEQLLHFGHILAAIKPRTPGHGASCTRSPVTVTHTFIRRFARGSWRTIGSLLNHTLLEVHEMFGHVTGV